MSGFFCTVLQFSPGSYNNKPYIFTGSFNTIYQSSTHTISNIYSKLPQNLHLSIHCIFLPFHFTPPSQPPYKPLLPSRMMGRLTILF